MRGHILIVGTTGCGKTTLARQLAIVAVSKRRRVVVFDPMRSKWPDGCLVYDDEREFSQRALRTRNALFIIDEAGETIGRCNYEMFWLATRARHLNAQSVFITHRPTQLSNIVRDNCNRIFMFRSTAAVAKMMSEEFTDDNLLAAVDLKSHEYLVSDR